MRLGTCAAGFGPRLIECVQKCSSDCRRLVQENNFNDTWLVSNNEVTPIVTNVLVLVCACTFLNDISRIWPKENKALQCTLSRSWLRNKGSRGVPEKKHKQQFTWIDAISPFPTFLNVNVTTVNPQNMCLRTHRAPTTKLLPNTVSATVPDNTSHGLGDLRWSADHRPAATGRFHDGRFCLHFTQRLCGVKAFSRSLDFFPPKMYVCGRCSSPCRVGLVSDERINLLHVLLSRWHSFSLKCFRSNGLNSQLL